MTAKLRSRGFTLIASLLLMLLLSGVAISLLMMVNTEQRVGGADLSNAYTYRAAEGGMEKMTSDLAAVFKNIQSPSNTEICNSILPPTLDTTVSYPLYTVAPVPGMPTQTSACPPLPNPVPWGQIQTGPDSGLYAQILPIVLNVQAQRSGVGSLENVSMTRTAEVVLIPVFQFGVFSDSDLFFGQSPNLAFAGRVHTNGDLYLGVANGSDLVFGDKMAAFGNVVRDVMDNGMQVGGGLDDGTVLIPNTSNGCSVQLAAIQTGAAINATGTCVNIAGTGLGSTNGSVVGAHASAQYTGWTNVSQGTYNSYLIDGNGAPPSTTDGPNSTGASDLTLPFVQGTTSAVQIIRQPPPGESQTSLLGASRLANEAQIRVILSDTEDGLHLPGWNGNSAQDVQLVSELPTTLAAMNQGQDLGSPGVQANVINVGGSGRYYSFGESYCTGSAVAAVSNAAAVLPATAYGTLGTNTTPAKYSTTFNSGVPVYGTTASGNYIASNYQSGTYNCPTLTGHGTYANAATAVTDNNFVIPWYFGGPGYSGGANNWPPTVYPQTPQTYPALVAGANLNFTTPNGGTNGLEWPLIGGWLLVEYLDNNGVWHGVTTEWLGLGFARGLNVPTEAGFNCGALGYTNGTNTLVAGTTGVNPNGCNYLGDHANAILYFEETKDADLAGKPGTAAEDQPLTANYYDSAACVLGACKSQYNWYPINLYDAREGENYDANPGTYAQGSGTPNGVLNAVELDVGNLRQWLLGKTGVSGTLVNYTAQNGYVLYFSDRRGMQFTNTGGAGQSQSQWGEYGFEDTVNFQNLANNLKPDGRLDPNNYNGVSPEDVNSNTVLDSYGVFGVGDAFGPSYHQDTDVTVPPTPYAQTAGESRISTTTTAVANRVTGARHALKLVDGSLGNVPVMPPASACVQTVANPTACGGFTVASENPVYIQGNYNTNCPTAGGTGCTPFNTTYDTTWNPATPANPEPNHAAASVIADAVTLLSNHWQDWGCQKVGGVFGTGCNSAINTTSGSMINPLLPNGEGGTGAGQTSRVAYTTYYRTAIAGGKTIAFNNVAGSPDAYFGSDGGVHNFLRQLEDWENGGAGSNVQQGLYYKGSMVSLYWNAYATGTWKCCNLVYTPPSRQYVFDPLFTSPQNLPPATPMFRNVDNLSYRQNQVARTN